MPSALRPLAMSLKGLPGPSELRLMSSGIGTGHQLLFHLMELAVLSTEIETHIEAFFDGSFKRED